MRSKIFSSILCVLAFNFCKAQNTTVVLDTSMFDEYYQVIHVAGLNGWIFKQGNDTNWQKVNADQSGAIKLSPAQLTIKNADKNGRVEGWFRIRLKLDSTFNTIPVFITFTRFTASDVFIDGKYITSSGSTGLFGDGYKENDGVISAPIPVDLKPGEEHIIALHLVEHNSPLNPWHLKSYFNPRVKLNGAFVLAGPRHAYQNVMLFMIGKEYFGIWLSAYIVLSVLFWLLYFLNRNEEILLIIAVFNSFMAVNVLFNSLSGNSSFQFILYYYMAVLAGSLNSIFTLLILVKVLNRSISTFLKCLMILFPLLGCVDSVFPEYRISEILTTASIIIQLYYILSSWRALKGAQWSLVAGILLETAFGLLFVIKLQTAKSYIFPYIFTIATGIYFSVPLSLLVYVAIRFKEILNDVRTNAKKVVELSEEKKEQAIKQQKILEEEVARQTIELKTSLQNLKSTQAQLIQSEKMASLGELTAGIAHEIQNPLNFVNNFSEVNNEMIDEATEEIKKGNYDELKIILVDIKENSEKINHHGKRADAIVKSMLQHSKQTKGVKEPTDINALCDEYLRLSYHGLRAKDKNFNADFKTDFDESIGKINVVPQDIGRVLLNIINNAFYAVKPPNPLKGEQWQPLVSVTTKKIKLENNNAAKNSPLGAGGIEIIVSDNGSGIPQNIIDKIFQPFFTTKPTGEGTGLGLSLSYDIIKAHGGEIKVETKEGEGTTFIINLPVA